MTKYPFTLTMNNKQVRDIVVRWCKVAGKYKIKCRTNTGFTITHYVAHDIDPNVADADLAAHIKGISYDV